METLGCGGVATPGAPAKDLSVSVSSQQAFWCLVQICDKYLPGYYSAGLVSVTTFLEGKGICGFIRENTLCAVLKSFLNWRFSLLLPPGSDCA